MVKNESRFKNDEEATKWARLTLSPDAKEVLKILNKEVLQYKNKNKTEAQYDAMSELALHQLLTYSKALKRIVLNSSGRHIAYVFDKDNHI